MLAHQTSPQAAVKAARQLVGCWPHARPPEPETYAAALAAVLAQYPLGVVNECVDPRRGLAREREFPPTVAAVVEWCGRRLAWHRSVAAWREPAPPLSPPSRFTDQDRDRGAAAMRGLRRALHDGDAAELTFDEAIERGRQ